MELSLKELCLNKLGGMSIRRIKYELSEGKAPIELISLVCLRIIELRVFEKHPGKIYRIVCEICKEDLTMVKENLSIVKRGDYIYILAKSGYSLTLSLWRNGRCFRQPFQYKTVARGSNKSNYLNIIGSLRSITRNVIGRMNWDSTGKL